MKADRASDRKTGTAFAGVFATDDQGRYRLTEPAIEQAAIASGQERTEAEFRALFAAAGFRLTRIVPTKSPVCVVEGVPV